MSALPPLLDGIRIVDLTTFLSGPFGTQMLADLGADVIKVESLDGDSSRAIPPHFVGEDSAYFLTNNRSKRSIAMNLKDPQALDAVLRLIDGADIVIENFRPGVCKRLGIDPEVLRGKRPELIWVSISGFGQVGPWRDKPAYDMIVQALSGVMSLTGEPGRPAVRLGIPAGDLVAGMFAAYGALGAYIRRLRTGVGAAIDVSMLDSQLAMTSYQAVYAMFSGITPTPQGARHDSIPTYRSFVAADDREFVVTANTERMWKALARVVDREDLIDDVRFADAGARLRNRDSLWAILEPAFRQRAAQDWVDALEVAQVPSAMIKTVPEAIEDARAAGRGMIVELDDGRGSTVEVVGNPVRLGGASGYEHQRYSYPPTLGLDTRAVLASVGVDDADIDAMVERGVIAVGRRTAAARGATAVE
ncbi:CoA transferase [Agrococcus sp. 1P02AA]|uniref:CaiB/BaiF CoA transferase family protein n=1 Tax=Agrococcus sp. 1P02AA TaxID=3132259 RepID=UPI0039A597FD